MQDVVLYLYIHLTSSALLHLASMEPDTANAVLASSLILSHERLRLRVVPRSSVLDGPARPGDGLRLSKSINHQCQRRET